MLAVSGSALQSSRGTAPYPEIGVRLGAAREILASQLPFAAGCPFRLEASVSFERDDPRAKPRN